jgi:hypothetical protein
VAIVPATFELAVAWGAEHQVDPDAGCHDRANQGRAMAGQVFCQSTIDVAVQGDTYVVPGMGQRPIKVSGRPPSRYC